MDDTLEIPDALAPGTAAKAKAAGLTESFINILQAQKIVGIPKTHITAQQGETIPSILGKNSNITEFWMDGVQFDNGSGMAETIKAAGAAKHTLTMLGMRNMQMTDDAAGAINESRQTNPIAKLDLENTALSERQTEIIARAAGNMPYLTSLNLVGTGIGSNQPQMVKLVQGLQNNPAPLMHLNIYLDHVGSENGKILAALANMMQRGNGHIYLQASDVGDAAQFLAGVKNSAGEPLVQYIDAAGRSSLIPAPSAPPPPSPPPPSPPARTPPGATPQPAAPPAVAKAAPPAAQQPAKQPPGKQPAPGQAKTPAAGSKPPRGTLKAGNGTKQPHLPSKPHHNHYADTLASADPDKLADMAAASLQNSKDPNFTSLPGPINVYGKTIDSAGSGSGAGSDSGNKPTPDSGSKPNTGVDRGGVIDPADKKVPGRIYKAQGPGGNPNA